MRAQRYPELNKHLRIWKRQCYVGNEPMTLRAPWFEVGGFKLSAIREVKVNDNLKKIKSKKKLINFFIKFHTDEDAILASC